MSYEDPLRIRRNLKLMAKLALRGRVYTIRHGLAKGLKRKGGVGFLPQRMRPLTREQRFLARLDLAGATVYDVGAYEGVLTMFFARAVGPRGLVVAFEPNPINLQRLKENLRLNGFANVTVRPVGLGENRRRVPLVFPEEEPGRGSVDRETRSRLVDRGGTRTVEVELLPLDEEISGAELPPPDFVKVDVEGSERAVLTGGRKTIERFRPRVFLEMYGKTEPEKLDRAAWLVRFLKQHGYDILLVETGDQIDLSNVELAVSGHLYCIPTAATADVRPGNAVG